jgi:carbonic anhydrase
VQFHFHSVSEHRIDGLGYDMELHLVHASAGGSNAVIGVFLKRGASSGPLAAIFHQLPNDVEVKHPIETAFNPKTFLPKSNAHLRYVGSLTTPPCSEGVTWFVLKAPTSVSNTEVARFAKIYPMNARPTQSLNGREIRATP